MLIAADASGGHPGWYTGLVIGFLVVVVVVAVVGAILTFASRIAEQGQQTVESLERARASTDVLQDVPAIEQLIAQVRDAARAARSTLMAAQR